MPPCFSEVEQREHRGSAADLRGVSRKQQREVETMVQEVSRNEQRSAASKVTGGGRRTQRGPNKSGRVITSRNAKNISDAFSSITRTTKRSGRRIKKKKEKRVCSGGIARMKRWTNISRFRKQQTGRRTPGERVGRFAVGHDSTN